MSGITLISVLLTIIVYIGAKALSARLLSPFATPVFTATLIMILLLLAGGITYEEYTPAKNIMTFMLGPATVALAVPLYHNRRVIRERLMPAVIGLTAGTLSTITSAVLLAKVLGLPEKIQATSAVKAITTPVAIEAAKIIGGDPPLAAVFVISAGIFGAVMGSVILSFLRISDPFARGLGIGTVAHGIGTSQAAIEDPVQGAVSSAAMGFSAILTSLVIPWFYPLLQFLL
ncbi:MULTISPECIES: LrgB family protein [Bacillus]|uniref:LrgB family protein n=1 Tax=Bacillus infantis TaxID=324767 RepID=A0A5D4SNI9_9BACI|nr:MULTISPECIES: LrgB family protein [Bacillus]PLR74945.1 LrgB family protein [Bacillus sp. UMB0728]RYI29386.1 LrgB family protein [Bacillus infantis]TYS64820.1 LrgB family protein [Bacillus infantis]